MSYNKDQCNQLTQILQDEVFIGFPVRSPVITFSEGELTRIKYGIGDWFSFTIYCENGELRTIIENLKFMDFDILTLICNTINFNLKKVKSRVVYQFQYLNSGIR
jgi:hypothetical protein